MKPSMLQLAQKVTSTRNAYGDYTTSITTDLKCHFREITQQVTDDSSEAIQSDAQAWFEPDSGIDRKDIIYIHGLYYIIQKVTKARKLSSPNVQFIKCELIKYGAIS